MTVSNYWPFRSVPLFYRSFWSLFFHFVRLKFQGYSFFRNYHDNYFKNLFPQFLILRYKIRALLLVNWYSLILQHWLFKTIPLFCTFSQSSKYSLPLLDMVEYHIFLFIVSCNLRVLCRNFIILEFNFPRSNHVLWCTKNSYFLLFTIVLKALLWKKTPRILILD